MAFGIPPGGMILIDAHSLIFQVFHAIAAMTSPAGLPTNALFGFTRDVLFLRNDLKPEYLICAFDRDGKTFRDDFYPDYKAQRTPMPPDLRVQIPLIEEMLKAMRVPVIGAPGYEADDLIATVASAASERDVDVLICTSDKDCRQLINGKVRLFNLRKREAMDCEALAKDWGIRPDQVVDLQILVGDSVDNIPGVPGVGVKTAAKLLQEFDSLTNLVANLERVAGAKTRESIRAAADKFELSRKLVRLDAHVPMKLDWEDWRLQSPDYSRLLELFQEWGFRRFADEVRAVIRKQPPMIEGAPSGVRQRDLFKLDDGGPLRPAAGWVAQYHLVDTADKFEAFLKQLRQQPRFAFDLQTDGPDPRRARIIGCAFCWTPGQAWYVPVRAAEGDAHLDPTDTLRQLRPILEDPAIAKVNQNIKHDLVALRGHGVNLQGLAGDSMVADYLLHAGERSHDLDDLSNRYLDHPRIPVSELVGKRGKGQLTLDQVPTARLAEYAGEEVELAARLCTLLEPKLDLQQLGTLYRDLEVPLIDVLAELEYNGVLLDLPLLQRLGVEMEEQLKGIEGEIHRLAGRPFNIASPRQLRQVLFDELKLPAQRKTGITGEASTDQETLERLASQGHALPKLILEHRQIAKLKGTYVDALPNLINPQTERVHASFNQTVAATGRLSSSDPNLQNIPVRREQGRQIRQAFIPEAGWRLLTADYSQIELRLLAHFSGEEELQRAFAEDQDIHSAVASQVFGVRETDVTSDMRRAAKTINFGVIYGISKHGLAPRLGITLEEAAKFIDAFFQRYPKVAHYQTRLLDQCRRDRYVSTILGRRREISGIRRDSTYQQRNQPEREAINMQIQGSAADLIKAAMLNIYRRLLAEQRQTRMLLQIHDELVFEAPPDELDEVGRLVAHEMVTAIPLAVPLRVDVAVGPNWLDVEKWSPAATP
jgi:DNA polymerase-1